ncbi:MAG: sulfatase activating formylglycine-generating enzyme [Myxococcota bacterium]|jgi:formylglycine-generating enzyme required for sulfatase activity/tRNA A-37 threonylcarbamoyl transferase component Bud32
MVLEGDDSDTLDLDLDGSPARPPPSVTPVSAKRYEDLGRIGRGATGDVRRVRDRLMGRTLAMKSLRKDLLYSTHARARFTNEASLTAGLQHPGIIVVHDQGERPGGQPWFTMKEVRGQTLESVIAAVHGARQDGAWAETVEGWSFRRLIDALARICQAIAYAHSRSVVHRDIKPQNLMVGEFGAVVVMDWGLGRNLEEGDLIGEDLSTDALVVSPDLTRDGAVLGTPAYMAPEMAAGRSRGTRAADVYSLGAVLYQLLSGDAPYRGGGSEPWRTVLAGPPVPLSRIAAQARLRLPGDLIALCGEAMARQPEDRPTARALAGALVDWLDGARRQERAAALHVEAEATLPDAEVHQARAVTLRQQAAELLGAVEPLAPIAEKEPAWVLQDAARDETRQSALIEARYEQGLHAALMIDPESTAIRDRLSDLYRDRLIRAEERGDADGVVASRVQLETYDRGRHAAWLSGEGAVTLITDPPGATVTLMTFLERRRRLVPTPIGPLGVTPLRQVPIPRGSHLLRVTHPGFAPMDYPVHISRQQHWDGIPPGETTPMVIPLIPEDTMPAGACYVPGGWFACGGDPQAVDGLPAGRVWVDGFLMQRHPVTNGEYLRFINTLAVEGRSVAEIDPLLPMITQGKEEQEHAPVYLRESDGTYTCVPDYYGEVWADDVPITQITWHAARAYCHWAGPDWRLPDEVEWEKAARGVDRRLWPWGDHFEPSWACTVRSHHGAPRRVSIHSFSGDISPYGIFGMAGNIRDFCQNAWVKGGGSFAPRLTPRLWSEENEYVVLRGGNWHSTPAFCRPSNRLVITTTRRLTSMGFRMVRIL